MTNEEFSNEFDILINAYSKKPNFGEDSILLEFNEYEKSVFLTKAQEEILLSYYNGLNNQYKSFEETEELRRYFSSLVKTYTTSNKLQTINKIDNNSQCFTLPNDLWFIIYEQVKLDQDEVNCLENETSVVTPITHDEFYRTYRNPFRTCNKRRVLKLDNEGYSELISKYNITEYLVRYISKPTPIILVDLPNNLSIDNISNHTECNLHPKLHRIILDKAIQLALQSKNIQQ